MDAANFNRQKKNAGTMMPITRRDLVSLLPTALFSVRSLAGVFRRKERRYSVEFLAFGRLSVRKPSRASVTEGRDSPDP